MVKENKRGNGEATLLTKKEMPSFTSFLKKIPLENPPVVGPAYAYCFLRESTSTQHIFGTFMAKSPH